MGGDRTANGVLRKGLACLTFLISALCLGGCVSKSKADARARAAFFAGQQQAAMMGRQAQAQSTTFNAVTVTVLGEVRNSLIPWTAELTLGKAVIAADYYGRSDPAEIVIQRAGREISYDPKKLLGGQDVQLEPNDVIQLRH
jgi:hypothetical protein